jgi:hypothetical protein
MKKAFCVFAVFFGVLCAVSAQWETEQENDGLVITGYTGNDTAITIPDKINGAAVVGIGEEAFADTELTSVTLPNSVTTIGIAAFAGCSNLTVIAVDVRNPALSSVDGVLFSKDMKTLIAYPGGKSSNYTIPNSVTTIGDWAFGDTQLTSVTIPNSVTVIGDGAFAGTALTNVTIGNGVTTIGVGAFYEAQLTSVTIGNSVTTIGDSAFSETQLTSITLPNSVISIGEKAFYATPLTSVTIGNGLASIGDSAFRACSSLTTIAVDARNPAFSSVDNVLFSKDMKTLIVYPRGKKAGGYTIPNGVTIIRDSAFSETQLTSITIPNSVISIGAGAFYKTQLTSVTIPNSVTAIGDTAFSDCSSLTAIAVDVRNPTFSSVDGVLFSKDMKTLITYPKGNKSSSYTIPNGVTSIEDAAFYGAQLTNVTIPDSVISIGTMAFCLTRLTSVTIPDSVTSIGPSAFGWTPLRSVTIGNGVTTIGFLAFADTLLTSVTIPSATTIVNGAFGSRVQIIRR